MDKKKHQPLPAAAPPDEPTLQAAGEREEEARMTASQRRINVIWEATQSIIALVVISTGMFTACFVALWNDENALDKSAKITAFNLISNAVFLVIGFYFGRTNHTRTGGVGAQHAGSHR